ncbi:MAG TPA: MFS transporter, partial [Sporichthya sp.]|nr:MFS transporter [Sporichthya sp.]
IGVSIYRDGLDRMPEGVTPEAADQARDTLGGAVAAADSLPPSVGHALLDLADHAFVDGMGLSTAIAAVLATLVAAFAFVALHTPAGRPDPAADSPDSDPEGTVIEVADVADGEVSTLSV